MPAPFPDVLRAVQEAAARRVPVDAAVQFDLAGVLHVGLSRCPSLTRCGQRGTPFAAGAISPLLRVFAGEGPILQGCEHTVARGREENVRVDGSRASWPTQVGDRSC
jgi:hypothetical protein